MQTIGKFQFQTKQNYRQLQKRSTTAEDEPHRPVQNRKDDDEIHKPKVRKVLKRRKIVPTKLNTEMLSVVNIYESQTLVPRKRLRVIKHKIIINTPTQNITTNTTTTPTTSNKNGQEKKAVLTITTTLATSTVQGTIKVSTNSSIENDNVKKDDDSSLSNLATNQTISFIMKSTTSTTKKPKKIKKRKRQRHRHPKKISNSSNVGSAVTTLPSPPAQSSITVFTITSLSTSTRTRTYTLVVDRVEGTEHEIQGTSTFERIQINTTQVTLAVTQTLIATQKTYRPLYQNLNSGQDGSNRHELMQQATSTLQSSYNDIYQQSADIDEARYNLATRIMSNGVEVIIASDKTKTIDHLLHDMSSHQLQSKSNYKPMTLAASTIKNQMMILILPSSSTMDRQTEQFNYHVPFYTNHFITKTCLTTYTYRTTYVQDGQTTVESREKVVSNIATEERNYPKITPSQTMDVTLTRTPELAVGVFSTTYLYYNTFKDNSNNLQVMTSEHIVINTITGPDIAYLEPSAKATPVLETNTYYNKITLNTSISKDLTANNNNKMHTVKEILTQVIVTKSLPPARITSVLTSYNRFGNVTDTEKDNIGKFTLQILNEKHNEESGEKIIETNEDLEYLHIYATKKMLTTFTYYNTASLNTKDEQHQAESDNAVNPTSTSYNFHTRIIENIITNSVPFTLLPTDLLTKMKLELQEHQRRFIVATVTLKGGQTLKITAMKMHKPIVRTQAMSPYLKKSTLPTINIQQIMETLHETSILGNSDTNEEQTENEHEQLSADNYVNVEEEYSSPSLLSLENYGNEDLQQQHQDLQNNEEPKPLDAFSSEHVDNIVEAPMTNLTYPSNDLITVKPPTANQLIQRLTALRPMFNAMAGLWHNNFGVGIPEESKITPIKHIESKHAPNKKIMSNLTLGLSTQHPIYIPVQKPSTLHSKSKFHYHLENRTDRMPQSLHIQPPLVSEMSLETPGKNMWLMSPQLQSHKVSSVNTIPLAALSAPRKEQTLHNGGIYIRPGEVITANSDVIVGKPNGIEYVQTPQQNNINYANATTVNSSDNTQYQITYYQHNILHPYKKKSSSPALSTISSKDTRPQHIPIGSGVFELKESQQYDLLPPLITSNTENFNKNILKPPPLPYAPASSPTSQLQSSQSTAHNMVLPASIHKLTTAPVPERTQPYSGGTLPNLYRFNNNLKNNEILEIKRIPEVFSTDLKPTSLYHQTHFVTHHIQPQPQNTDYTQYNTYVTNFFPDRKATKIPIKTQNQPQLSYNWDSSALVNSANLDETFLKNLSLLKGSFGHSPAKSTQKLGFTDFANFSPLSMTNTTEKAKIINSNSSPSTSLTKNRQRISLQQNVFSHTVDVNVPPMTFNREDLDYPPKATNVRGQIPSLNSVTIKTSEEQHKYMPLIKIPANEQQVQVNLTPLNVINTIQAPIDETNSPLSYKHDELYDENSFHKVLNNIVPFNHHHAIQDQKAVATNNIVVMQPEPVLKKKWNYPQNTKHHLPSSAAAQIYQHHNIPHQLPGEGGLQRLELNEKEIQQPFKSLTEANKGWLKANNSLQKTRKTLQPLNQLEIKGSPGFSYDRESTHQFTTKTSTDNWLRTHSYDLANNLSYLKGEVNSKNLNFQHNENFHPEGYNTNVNLQQSYQAVADMKHSDHNVSFQLADTNIKNHAKLLKQEEKESQKEDYEVINQKNGKQQQSILQQSYTKNSPYSPDTLSFKILKDHKLQSHQKPPTYQSQYDGKLSKNRQKIEERFYENLSLKPEITEIKTTGLTETLAEDINEIIATNKKTLIKTDDNLSTIDTAKQASNQKQPFRRPPNNYTTKANDQIQVSNLYIVTEDGFKLVATEPPNRKIFRSSSYPTTEPEIFISFETKHDKQSTVHKYKNSNKLKPSAAIVSPLALSIQPPPLMKAASAETVVGMNPPPLPASTTDEIHSEQQPSPPESKNLYEARKRRPIQTPKDFISSSAQLAKRPESYQRPPTTLQRPYMKINRDTSQRPLPATTLIPTSAPKAVKAEKLPANKTSLTYEPVNETLPYLIHNADHLPNEKFVYHIEPSIIDDLTTMIMTAASLLPPSPLTPLLTPTTTLKRIVVPTKYVNNKHDYTVTKTATTTETLSLQYKLPTSILPTTTTATETTAPTATLLLTQTEITTVVDTVKTEVVKSSSIIATTTLTAPHLQVTQVSETSLLQLENSETISSKHYLPYSSVDIESTNITKDYDNSHQAQEGSSTTTHHHQQLAINSDDNSIFIVMTNNNKNSSPKSSVSASSTPFVNMPLELDEVAATNGGEMMGKSYEVVIDYDDTISFDAAIPTRDEEPLQYVNDKSVSNGKNGIGAMDEGAKAGNHILLGGVLIATPPKILNKHISYMTLNETSSSTDSCRPGCKSARNEICALLDKYWKCICRPGFARMFPDRPCKPTYTYSLLMHAERIGNYPLLYVQDLSDNTTDHFKQLSQLLHNALDRMIMQSDFRDAFHGVQLIQVLDDHKSRLGIMAKFLLQLSDNSDERRLEDVFKKRLRLSNFSIGGTDLYTNKVGVDALTINDFNECLNMKFHDCSKDARCFNLQGTYTCSCREGFADLSENTIYPGRLCSSEQIGCEKCHYHGTCSSSSSGTISNPLDRTFCECFPWYTGATCQVNLKILLIILLGIGTLLFIVLLFCILITCTKRRNNQHTALATSTMTSTSVSGSRGVGSGFTTNLLITSIGGSIENGRETVNKRKKSIKIDKRSIIKDSSSESSQNSVPYLLKNSELLNGKSQTKKSPHLYYRTKYSNYRAHINASDKYSQVTNNLHLDSQNEINSLMQPSSTLTRINHNQNYMHSGPNAAVSEDHYCEQSDRSLTVMIPRAKYHSSVLPQNQLMHHQLTVERTYNSNTLNSNNAMMMCSDKNLDTKQNQKKVSNFTGGDLHTKAPTNLGALISAGFEVSAMVRDHTNVIRSLEQHQNNDLTCLEQQTPARRSPSSSDPAIFIGIHRQCQDLSQINGRQRIESTSKTEADNFETESDYNIYNSEKESAEARSFHETTVKAATKPLLICIDENQTQQTTDEANTMAERDVGSTFLLPHTHLYKPERPESEMSGFDSF